MATTVKTGLAGSTDILDLLMNYAKSALATSQTPQDFSGISQNYLDQALAALGETKSKDIQSLQEGMASRNLGGSGIEYSNLQELLKNYATKTNELTSQNAYNMAGLESQYNQGMGSLGLQAANLPLATLYDYAALAQNKGLSQANINAQLYAQQQANDAAGNSSMWSGIGGLVGAVAPSLISAIGGLFNTSTQNSNQSNYSNYSGSIW
jgi:hypothetical protein